ncbi:MAG: serine/threonine-protein kinase, partial [Rubripirellula sp.]
MTLSSDGFDDELFQKAAEAYDASLRTGETVSFDFAEKHSDLASVFELLNDVFGGPAHCSDGQSDSSPASDPSLLSRFQIRQELGRGGFAIVYRAFDILLRREVAVKVIPVTDEKSSEAIEKQLVEARAAARLSHPNIVPLFDVHRTPKAIYLVSEFCDGPTLDAWIQGQSGWVAADVAATVIEELAQAVAHSHFRGLVHRDIKPKNV